MYKSKMKGVLGIALTVVLLASLMVGAAVAPAGAAGEAWTTFGYPRAGALSGYIIAPTGGLVAGPAFLEKSVDGTLYAYWDVGEATDLYKSANEGRTWSRCGRSTGPLSTGGGIALVDIACSTEDANLVYVASATTVYKSADAGATWAGMSALPAAFGATETITSLDVGYNGGSHYVVVGTTDAAANTYGDVFMKRDGFGTTWAAQGMTASVNVWDIACSPNFATEANPQIVAVVSSDIAAVAAADAITFTDAGAAADIVTLTFAAGSAAAGLTQDAASIAAGVTWVGGVLDFTGAAGGTAATLTANVPNVAVTLIAQTAGGATGIAIATDGDGDMGAAPAIGGAETWNDAAYTAVSYQYGGGAWNSAATPNGQLKYDTPAPVAFGNIASADIAFVDNYSSTFGAIDLFVGVNNLLGVATGGDVYHVFSNTAYDKDIGGANIDTDVTSVAVAGSSGSSKVLAVASTSGAANVRDIYRSTDDGASWLASKKDPSGPAGTATYVVMADDYYESGKAWVASGGANGGLSLSNDSGVLWTQISMIDTEINLINTLGFSPNYASDSTMFMVATNVATDNDLWRYDGTYWERVHDSLTFGMAAINTIRFSPDYASDSAVFIAATATPKIWRSTDGGTRFIPQTGAPTAFAGGWLVIDSSTMIVGRAAAGTATQITKNNGTTWSTKGATGAGIPQSFALSPDYANDSTILFGDNGGMVFRSTDGGSIWKSVPAAVAAGTGVVYAAFDPGYASNSTIYAADAGTDMVYRLVVGTDTSWKRIDGLGIVSWPGASTAGGAITGIAAVSDGTLYVADQGTGGVAAVAADVFTITATGADTGTITVGAGTVTATVGAGCSIGGLPVGARTITLAPGMGAVPFTLAIAGDTVVVTATNANASGTWAITAGAPAALVTADVDGDAFVAPAAGTWSLPDAATAATVGANHVMLRSVNPTGSRASTRGVYFEPMTYAFAGTAGNLAGVWCTAGSNQLWTLESLVGGPNRIWTYTDNLTAAPELKKPADKANTGRTTTASLSWNALPGCPRYEVWVSRDSGFSTFSGGSPGFSTTTSWTATGLSDGLTYYWKVCAAASNAATAGRAVSPWPGPYSFTTGIAAAEWSPFTNSDGVAPSAGAAGVSIVPAFQWNAADWATGYEFELSKDPRTTARGYFVEVVTSATGDNALVNSVWLCDRDLDYSTTYYWHVKAISATSKSEWGTGVFTTEAAPPAPEPPPPPPPPTPEPTTPGYIWAVIGIGAALCIAVVVLIVRTRRVA